MDALAKELGACLMIHQSNDEGDLVAWIQKAAGQYDALVINPGAYTHTSIALRDSIAAVDIPTVEVHLSNLYRREEFRQHSYIPGLAGRSISGIGPGNYSLGVRAPRSSLPAAQSTPQKLQE